MSRRNSQIVICELLQNVIGIIGLSQRHTCSSRKIPSKRGVSGSSVDRRIQVFC